MKSDIIKLSDGAKDISLLNRVLSETEKAAAYANLDKKQSGRLRLLAEEMISMLPELLAFSSGEFWIECNGKNCEIHTVLTPQQTVSIMKRDELLKISKSGKNAAATGIMAKIRIAVTFMMFDPQIYTDMDVFLGTTNLNTMTSWSLSTYRQKVEEKKGEPWDELEKSIIANIADDVLVGVEGKRVEIVVKKAF